MAQPPAQLKYQLLQHMVHFVYEQAQNRLDETLKSIIDRNDIAHNMQRLVFSYAGRRWTRHTFKGVPQKTPYLDEMLHPEMDAYLAEIKEIEEVEKPLVTAYIRAILNSDPDPVKAMLRIPTALQNPIRDAIVLAEEGLGQKANLNFEQVEELVGAYPAATQAIRKRMMFNVLLE